MRLRIVLAFGTAILVIGIAAGFYLELLFQKQIQLLVTTAIIFAFLTWLGSGADFLGLLREMYIQEREEENRRKSAIYSQLEPLFTNLRSELHFALEAHKDHDEDEFSKHLNNFQSFMVQQHAVDGFRRAQSNAPEVYDIIRNIQEKIREFDNIESFPNLQRERRDKGEEEKRIRIISEKNRIEEELARLVKEGIAKIDAWLEKWDKWHPT